MTPILDSPLPRTSPTTTPAAAGLDVISPATPTSVLQGTRTALRLIRATAAARP